MRIIWPVAGRIHGAAKLCRRLFPQRNDVLNGPDLKFRKLPLRKQKPPPAEQENNTTLTSQIHTTNTR